MAEVHVNVNVLSTQSAITFHNPAIHPLKNGAGTAPAATVNPRTGIKGSVGQVAVTSNGPVIENPA